MKETIIKVEGMSCQHCVKAVTGALQALPGVAEAKVDLEAGTAAVTYDENKVSPEAMKAAILDQGYDVA